MNAREISYGGYGFRVKDEEVIGCYVGSSYFARENFVLDMKKRAEELEYRLEHAEKRQKGELNGPI